MQQGETAHTPTCKSPKCHGKCMGKKEGDEEDTEAEDTEDQIDAQLYTEDYDNRASTNQAYASEEADTMLQEVRRACQDQTS